MSRRKSGYLRRTRYGKKNPITTAEAVVGGVVLLGLIGMVGTLIAEQMAINALPAASNAVGNATANTQTPQTTQTPQATYTNGQPIPPPFTGS
jgi:hypothetical protein